MVDKVEVKVEVKVVVALPPHQRFLTQPQESQAAQLVVVVVDLQAVLECLDRLVASRQSYLVKLVQAKTLLVAMCLVVRKGHRQLQVLVVQVLGLVLVVQVLVVQVLAVVLVEEQVLGLVLGLVEV